MKRYNAKRKGSAFPKYVLPAYRDWIRSHACLIAGLAHRCIGRTQAAHVKSRGAGGADAANLVPLCALHHHTQHAKGLATFERRWGVHLENAALNLWDVYQAGATPTQER